MAILTIINQKKLKLLLIFLLAIILTGCASSKKVNYFQDRDELVYKETIVNYQPIVQYVDLLHITVSSIEPELAAPYNLFEI